MTASARAALLMLAATFSFAAIGALVRLASEELHAFEIVFFRNALALVALAPLLRGGVRMVLRTSRFDLHLGRAVISFAAMSCVFVALSLIPLAEVTAITFSAPLFATLGAVAVLGEVVRAHRTAALAAGFLGVLIVLRPGVDAVSFGAALALASAVLIGVSVILIKLLTRTDAPESITLWNAALQTVIALPPALAVWRWPGAETWVYLILLGLAGAIAQLSITRASALADVTMLQPIEFVRLPFVALLGYLLFDQTPTIWTWIGGAAIFASTAYITLREARLARARPARASARPPPTPPE